MNINYRAASELASVSLYPEILPHRGFAPLSYLLKRTIISTADEDEIDQAHFPTPVKLGTCIIEIGLSHDGKYLFSSVRKITVGF